MRLTRNTSLIAGGTSGIGRGLAEAFHRCGNKVIIAGRRMKLLKEITEQQAGVDYILLDVTEAKSLQAAVAQIPSRFPALNVLIANAGISRPKDYKAERIETATVDDLLQTNS